MRGIIVAVEATNLVEGIYRGSSAHDNELRTIIVAILLSEPGWYAVSKVITVSERSRNRFKPTSSAGAKCRMGLKLGWLAGAMCRMR